MTNLHDRVMVFGREEALIIHQAFNKVLNGFGYDTPGVAEEVLMSKGELRSLWDRIPKPSDVDCQQTRMELNLDEIQTFGAVLRALRFGLDEWDFATRMGFEIHEVEAFQNRLKSIG